MPKKVKDLDPKSRSKKVKGGGLSNDMQHAGRDTGRVSKLATDTATSAIRTGAQAPGRAIRNRG